MNREIDLEDFRKRHGLTQVRLALLLNDTPISTLRQWLSGTRKQPKAMALALAYLEEHPHLMVRPPRKMKLRRKKEIIRLDLPKELRWKPQQGDSE